MGFYVNVHAKKGCETQINELWAMRFPEATQLIATRDWIEQEIEYINNDPAQQHMSDWLKIAQDWNEAFPIHAEGRGQVFIGSCFVGETDNFSDDPDVLRAQIKWILEHRFLFSSVTGLFDAVDSLGMDIPYDEIENGRTITHYELTFDDLPVMPKSAVYRLCVEDNRPAFWNAYLNFKETPNWENWDAIRHMMIPGRIMGKTLWQQCEAFATQLDGESYGIYGRYRDGHYPELWHVEKAIALHGVDTPEEIETFIEEATKLHNALFENDEETNLNKESTVPHLYVIKA